MHLSCITNHLNEQRESNVLKKTIYFDNAATTRMDDRVLENMLPYMKDCFGNASGKYSIGYEARKAVNEAGKQAADMLGAWPDEIYFTSGGTEGNNMVIRGFMQDAMNDEADCGIDYSSRIIISDEIEHDSIIKTLKTVEKHGAKVITLRSDSSGFISPKSLEETLQSINGSQRSEDQKKKILVSVMMVNNETGTIEPVKELAATAHAYNCLFHTDAVQAAGHIGIDVKDMDIDLLTVSGHKLYGPKGTGLVYIKRGVKLPPMITGGGQERGMRSGTENVPGIVGLGKACELVKTELEANCKNEVDISEKFRYRLLNSIPGAKLNGNGRWILNFSFPGINGTSLVLRLDMEDICVSTGSACSAGLDERSHVLSALGIPAEQIDSSIRISIGKFNTPEEAEYTCECIERLVGELRSLGA